MLQYINGQLVNGCGRINHVLNPSTGEEITAFKNSSPSQALEALNAAKEAFPTWSLLSIADREKHILRLAEALEARKEEIVNRLIEETGKPMDTALYDFNMLIDCLRYFNEEAKRIRGESIADYDGAHRNFIHHKPIGVVVGYLAWNFPLLNVGYKLGPILASGCTCVLKPASVTPLATLMVGQAAAEIGFPAGVINIVSGSSEICQVMNSSKIPAMLTVIGSSQTGRQIISESATSIKRFSLELGGNAPVIILDDADIEETARITVRQKFDNCGQVCVSPNRIFVPEKALAVFLQAAKDEAQKITLTCEEGSGQKMGPLMTEQARCNIESLVKDAIEKGAEIVCGGERPNMPGFYYRPTILAHVTKQMRVYREEIFGPVMPVISYGEDEDLIALANDTEYGLAGYLYTHSLEKAMDIAEHMRFGSVCVNEPFYAFQLPHGGVKESGVGKDCSHFSIEEYLEVRRIAIKK